MASLLTQNDEGAGFIFGVVVLEKSEAAFKALKS